MSEESLDKPSEAGIRISLKWMLGALILLGAGFGLLGRMFFRHHEAFQITLGVLSTIVPFLLAIGTLVVFAHRQRRRGLVVWALAILSMPLLGLGTLYLSEVFIRPGPGGLGMMTTQQIIAKEMPTRYDQPWLWNELNRRLQDGKLAAAEADAAIVELARQMKVAKPGGWDNPMNWQSEFLAAAFDAGMVSDESLSALSDAFYGSEPTVYPLQRLREGMSQNVELRVRYGSTWAEHSGLPLRLLWGISKATIDGEPIEFNHRNRDVRSADFNGYFKRDFDAGDHKLELELQCAYIDSDKLFGLDTNNLPADRWPTARKSWTKKIEMPFKVYTGGQQIVKLVTDPKLDPMSVRSLRIDRFVVQKAKEGYSVAVKFQHGETLPISVSMDVMAVIDDQEVGLGHSFALLKDDGWVTGATEHQGELDKISPETRFGDVLLAPNATYIERYPEAKTIWGKPIRFRNLPLERLDLQQESESGEN